LGTAVTTTAVLLPLHPPPPLKKTLEVCAGFGKILASKKTPLICPVSSHVVGKCCNDPAHIHNQNSSTGTLNFDIVDPTAIVNPKEPLLRNCTTSGGSPLWSFGNGVYLAWVDYRDLAGAIGEMAVDNTTDDSVSDSPECAQEEAAGTGHPATSGPRAQALTAH
jgi:hypothetical protein